MSGKSDFTRGLDLVRQRALLDSILKRSTFFIIVLSAGYLALLLVARLTGLLPDYFSLMAVLFPILLGLALGLCFHRRITLKDAARLTDAKMDTKDLFLTAVLLDKSHGEYRPLLLSNAQAASEKIKPSFVVSYKWQVPARTLLAVVALLLLCSWGLPQLDPFGRKLAEKKIRENNLLLNKMDDEVKKKLEALKKSTDAKNSPEVARAVDELKKEFDNLKLDEKKLNAQKLQEMNKELNSLLKEKTEEKLQDMLNRSYSQQSFGKMSEQAEKWKEEIKKGDFSGIKKEISEMKEMAEKLSGMNDSAEKQKKVEELGQKLKDLSNFNKNELGSKSVQAALETAMKELGMAGDQATENEALSALQNSMNLGERELEKLEQLMDDMKSLESAAKAAQLAKALNELNALQKASGQGLQDMLDYEKFYKDMLKNAQGDGDCDCEGECDGSCDGTGKGKKGKGKGKGQPGAPGGGGGVPGENENTKTAFKDEISKSKLQAGKTIMEWKTKEVGEAGVAKEEYLETIKEVKQGVSEAIVKEQVPPGYHDAIKNYFGTLGEDADKKNNK